MRKVLGLLPAVILAVILVAAFSTSAHAVLAQGIPDNAKGNFLGGQYKCSDTMKWRLYVTANTTATIGNLTACTATGELSGGNYAAANASGCTVSTDTSNHYAILTFTSPSWSTLTAAHVDMVVLCDYTSPNDTTNGTAVGIWTFSDTPVSAGTLTLTVPTAAYNTGLLTWH